eukprot:3026628-Alexandrium_andersonii.AAC.1
MKVIESPRWDGADAVFDCSAVPLWRRAAECRHEKPLGLSAISLLTWGTFRACLLYTSPSPRD